jgi:hypothetical protein
MKCRKLNLNTTKHKKTKKEVQLIVAMKYIVKKGNNICYMKEWQRKLRWQNSYRS